jgi:hypothetical protein
MKITIELKPAFPEDTPEELWEAMQDDMQRDPRHRLTLETQHFIAEVTLVEASDQ